MTDILSTAAKFPDLLKEIYGDLAKPGVSEVGKAIGGLVGLGNTVLIPVHLANAKGKRYLERNLEKYREEIEKVPSDDIIEVTPEIGVPILEKLSYVSNQEISDMYINLLGKASSKKGVDQAHPGFVKIVDGLSPDESIFIKKIGSQRTIPFIEIRLNTMDGPGWNVLADMVIDANLSKGVTYPNNISAYLSNLAAMGVLKIRHDSWIMPVEDHYDPIWEQNKPKYENLEGGVLQRSLTYQKGTIDFTPFGDQFIQSCFTKIPN